MKHFLMHSIVFILGFCTASLLPPQTAAADNTTLTVVSKPLLHTFVEIKAYGDNASAAIEAALSEMQRVNSLLNNYDTKSEISRINSHAGQDPVPVSPDTFLALNSALEFCALSGGALDITIGPLLRLWGFAQENPGLGAGVPPSSKIQEAKKLVDYRNVELGTSGDAATARLVKKGMWIDVGSFSKGYCADRALAVLKKYGIKNALVSSGGTICGMGNKPDGSPWKVAVRHPRKDDYLTFIPLVNASVSTSGDYERFYMKKGKRRGHIIDPRTGCPVERMQSVSVIAHSGMASDALSTTLFVLGPQKGLKLIESLPGASALVIAADGTIGMSRDWPEKIVLY